MKFFRRQFLKFAAAAITAPALPRLVSALDYPVRPTRIAIGGETMPGSPADFGKLIRDETEKWGKVVRAGGLKPE